MARLGTAPTRVFGVKETRLSGRGGGSPVSIPKAVERPASVGLKTRAPSAARGAG